jgi:hypothetical protein
MWDRLDSEGDSGFEKKFRESDKFRGFTNIIINYVFRITINLRNLLLVLKGRMKSLLAGYKIFLYVRLRPGIPIFLELRICVV